ncbi:MAG TPA: HNH endonuclease signature motif containing protein [Candidatus Binatia bacterium]|nr:HNH endonuclease signature motif containing protein [Candidatus Binatia bacterium]
MVGADVPASVVAEAVAAEAMSWPYCDPPGPETPPQRRRTPSDREQELLAQFQARYGTIEGFSWLEPRQNESARSRELDLLLAGLAEASPREIDTRLRTVLRAMQRVDGQLSTVLRDIADAQRHHVLGFANLRIYAESRLGICGAKALALVRLERQCGYKSPRLLDAYRKGRVGWLAVTELLKVITREHEKEWIARAEVVTLRRLRADVSWALDRRDDPRGNRCQAPPPIDLDVVADAHARIDQADVQMRAETAADLGSFSRRVGARIRIVMPESVANLLEEAIEGCRRAIEPRWRAFERIVAHAYQTWIALPPHPSPVFGRDNYRCQAPGCSRRGWLHRHHVRYRSHGGSDDGWNLVAVCNEHHREYIHLGVIHVEGCAPDALLWELGCRSGQPPLMRLRGDVYLYK